MLERSADAFDWNFVAEWFSPRPDVSLNLAMADQRPPPSPPQVVSWNPAAVSCNDCARPNVDSVQANHILEVTFSDQIHWGGGNVILERGGLTNTPLDPVLDARWFQVRGSRLRIIPPPEVPLGASSSCSRVRFDSEALQNADGEFLVPGNPYSICIADTVPPTLMRTDPLDGSVNQGLLPRILLEFNEEVTVHLNPAPVQLVPIGSSTAQPLTIQMGDTSKVRITSCGYCALAGMVELLVLSPLEPETEYELRVPSTSISDASGNAWPGTVLSFTTECPASGCASTPAPTPPPVASDNKEEEEAQNIPLYLGIVGGVACCGAGLLAAWKYYVRHYVLPNRQSAKEHTGWTVPSAPTPAWTAKSGSVTSGWRKPQSNNGNAGGPGLMGGVTVGSPTSNSGSFGFSASRVTAPVPPAGPRAAAAPAKEEARQPPRASAPPGAVPAKQPPSQPPMAQDSKRAQTDEDLKRNTASSPSASTFAAAGKQGSFADDSAVSGGWVRTVDAASGRTYWYHYKTRETRWDEPPRSGQSQGPPTPPRPKPRAAPEAAPQPGSAPPEPKAAGPEPKASGGAASPQGAKRGQSKPESAKAPPPVAKAPGPPPENTKAGRVKADVLEQLEKTKKEDIASRKKTFRFLCLQWHPDKNQEDSELATEVFQFMQLQRDWYLKE